MNIQNEISEFSYINKTIESIFLEEDCDFTLFYNAYKAKYNKELKTNPDYFKGDFIDNGDHFIITPSPFYKDLFKAITKDS